MSKGVSEIATAAMYIGVTVAAISGAVTVGVPALENMQDAASIRKAERFMQSLDRNVEEVVAEGEGSTRTLSINFDRGEIYYDNSSDSLVYELETDAEVISPQTSRETGNVVLSSSADVTVRETTVDGVDCYQMENEHIKACIRDVGSQDNRQDINTSKLLVQYEFKNGNDPNQNLDGNLTVELNDVYNTSYGQGYTYAPQTKSFLGTGEVVATVSSNYGFTYDIIFQLPTGSDFLKIDVQNFR